MEYGKVNYQTLNKEDFLFDPAIPQPFLPGAKAKHPKLYLGFPKWGRKHHIGTFYPRGTKDADFLGLYTNLFNAVELNATHYDMPSVDQIRKWQALAEGKDFLFCPKLLNEITHYGNLSEKHQLTSEFTERIKEFKNNLGPVFMQVSDKFSPRRKHELFEFLQQQKCVSFLELRHKDWYEKAELDELLQFLQQRKIGLVITDTPGHRKAFSLKLATPAVYIRFVCRGDHTLDDFRIQEWKKLIVAWIDQGMTTCYFFLHLDEETSSQSFYTKTKSAFEPLFR